MSSVQSVDRAFAVLRCLSGGPAGVSQIAERVQLPKSTVSRMLSTLADLGAVEQVDAGGDYRIGHLMIDIASAALPGRSLVAAARPHLEELSSQLGEAVGLSVLDGFKVYYLDQVETDSPVKIRDWTGELIAAHLTSSGLVLAAMMPPADIEEFLKGPLEANTPRSMTDSARLRHRLNEVAGRGYEWQYEEFAEGFNSVAAVIMSGGRAIAAVHAHGPSYRFPAPGTDARTARRVVDTANRIADRIG